MPPPEALVGAHADEIAVVTTRSGLDSLEADWTALFETAGRDIHAFQSFNWIWHWAQHFLPAADGDCGLYIITGRRNGQLVLVCPLVRQRVAGLTVLSFAGDPVGQYGDVLVDGAAGGDELLMQAWRMIAERSGADVIALRRVRSDSNIARLLDGQETIVTDRQIAPFLDLTSAADFSAYEARYSAKARKNRRRLMRRLDERGRAQVVRLTTGRRAGELARLAISLKRAWVRHSGRVSRTLANPATLAFFGSAVSSTERPIGAVVTLLESCGEAAAIEIAFDCKGRRAVHVIVYALKFEKTGAGQLLLERCVDRAMDDGIATYDLLAPGDAYKLDWADGHVEVLDLAQPLTRRGRAFARLYLAHGRHTLKAAANRVMRTVRRVFARRAARAA